MHEIAYAKINLALHVRGRQADGYHSIETLFAFAEDGDRLDVEESDELGLAITGNFAASLPEANDNLVLCAARALRERFGIARGASLTLDKRLPVASGIGGGSADAAAALRLLDRWWEIGADGEDIDSIARQLGADVPACLASRTARGEGRGDILHVVDPPGLKSMPLLLVNPGIPLATADVFARWDGGDGGAMPADYRVAANQLEAPATGLVPEIRQVLERLGSCPGATLARMSGSGATCFALFESEPERDAAYEAIAARHRDWWLLASRIR